MKNQVIRVTSLKQGQEVKKYWEGRGCNTKGLLFNSIGDLYGVVNGDFYYWSNSGLRKIEYEEIQLPSENEYPKMMMVSNSGTFGDGYGKVLVLGEINGQYLTPNDMRLNCDDITQDSMYVLFKYAKDIESKEEDKEVKHLLKEGDCVSRIDLHMYNAILNIAKVNGIQLSSEIETDTIDIKLYPNLVYMEGVLRGSQLPTTLRKDQFINKMIGVEEKPKEIKKVINNVVCTAIDKEGNIIMEIKKGEHRGYRFKRYDLLRMVEMLHTLEEMK